MQILFVCSLFVACALAHGNYGQQQGYSSAGLIDYPYEVLYDSKRDGPNEPPGIRRADLIDIPYITVYDSKRDGNQRMNNYQQPQMNNYQQPQMNYQRQMPQRQQYQPMRNTNYQRQQTNYGGSSNLIDIPYIVEYDSRRDGPNSPKRDLFKNANLVDVPYITVYDSRRDGPNRRY